MKHTKHYIQDAGEKYFVVAVCKELVRLGKLHSSTSLKQVKADFDSYVSERDCEDDFANSDYKKTYDVAGPRYANDLVAVFGNSATFAICDVEKDARNAGKKADFMVEVYVNGKVKTTVNQSLKAYDNCSTIQVCSGTFLSTPLSMLMEKRGVGKFVNPVTGEVFSSSNFVKLHEALLTFGKETLKNVIEVSDIQREVETWKTDPTKENYFEIEYTDAKGVTHDNQDESAWEAFCYDIGMKGRDGIAKIIQSVDDANLKRFFGKVLGITGEEEVLILDSNGIYINSLLNKKAKELVKTFQDEKSKVKVVLDDKKGITLQLVSSNGQVVMGAYIPMTINKNGMWQLDEEGGRLMTKGKNAGKVIPFGKRRSCKLEIATSTNCWIDVKKYLL